MRVFNWVLGFLYCLLLAAIVIWTANYLRLNNDTFSWTFRWWAASGTLFGAFLLTAIARNMLVQGRTVFVLFQVLVVGLLFYALLPFVNAVPGGNWYAFMHILLAVFGGILNLRYLSKAAGGESS